MTYANATKTTYNYDGLDRVLSIEHRKVSGNALLASFEHTLGPYTVANWQDVIRQYEGIQRLLNGTIKFLRPRGWTHSNDYDFWTPGPVGGAYRKTDNRVAVWLRSAYFEMPSEPGAYESQPGVLIHEIAHELSDGGAGIATHDNYYGLDGVMEEGDPRLADSYKFFARDAITIESLP